MATKHLCLFFLLTLLSSTQIDARESQMFNKIPSKVNENVVKGTQVPNKQQQQQEEAPLNTNEQQEQPSFIPQNENSYGLYGHESGQFPPSTAKDSNFPYNAKYLPKNYNPVAYVTEPEDFNDSSSFEEKSYTTSENKYLNNNNEFYNGGNNFYNGMKDSEFMDREYINTENTNNYNGLNNYNLQQNNLNNNNNNNNNYNLQQNNLNNNNNYYNGGRMNRVQPQGMSDTRFLENGKYYFDINTGRHSRDPYETAKEFAMKNQYNNRGYYGNNNENSYQYNHYKEGGQEQYHDEDDMP